jgi:hypothetical protein
VAGAKYIRAIAVASVISLVAPLCWAGQLSPGEIHSGGQSVVLVAQLPETASTTWFVSPVPQASLQDGQTADLVVLRQAWTFARGETLNAECQVTTEPQATAQLLTSTPQYLDSFLGTRSLPGTRQEWKFPLVTDFDPGKGSVTDAQILLIVRNAPGEASSASVRITVVAL